MSTPETMRFICAGCGYRARIPTSYAGKVILCPGCQQMQIATADGGEATGDTVRVSKVATAPGTGRFSVPDADGHLRFTCSGCGYGAKLASSYAGKAISCPQCKSPQLIPPLQGPESAPGKALPSPAREPAAGRAHDELDFADETVDTTAPPAAATGVAPVGRPAPPAGRPAADPADEISFELEPTQPPAVATQAPAAAKVPQKPRPSGAAAQVAPAAAKPGAKPGTGAVVRRGSRMPLPAAPADDSDEEGDDDATPVAPRKPLPPWAQGLVARLKEPRMMALVGGSLAALILLAVLINGWAGATSAAADFQAKAEASEARAKGLDKGKADAEFELSKVRADLGQSRKSETELKATLATAQAHLVELAEQVKKAEADKAEEYAKRKKAEADQDEMFAKYKTLEKKREEEYRISSEMRRKFEEEAKLRKDLKVRLEEAQAAAK